MSKSLITLAALAFMASAAPAFAATAPAPECAAGATLDTRVAAALAKPDRPADQKDKDATRISEVKFVLAHVKPGDHVLDVGAGGGYSSMVLSAAICDGQLDSQNPQKSVASDKAKAARDAMLAARPNIHAVTADFDKLPKPAKPYDVIFIGTVYHDTYNVPGAPMPFFSFTYVKNTGMSFGILSGSVFGRWFLTLFQLAAAAALGYGTTKAKHPLLAVALAMIAGGACGNVIDRIRFGSVVDFLDFSGLYFPWVFNIADSAISIGVALLAWHFLKSESALRDKAGSDTQA